MANKDEQNNYLSNYPGMEKMVELTAGLADLILKSEEIQKTMKDLCDRVVQAITPLVSELYSSDFYENITKTFKRFADGVLLYRLQTLGYLEWCCIDEWVHMDQSDENEWSFSSMVLLKLEREENFSPDKLDRYIGRRFSKEIIRSIEEDTALYLEKSDVEKLKRAMVDFRARRYMDSANLLAGLIDSQSIKQELYDIDHNKYCLDNYDQKNGIPNFSQGWKAFHIVFSNNFSKYFDGEKFNGKGKKDRQDGFNNFVNNIKGKMPSDDNITSIVALSFCLLRFFDESNFKDYPEYIPSSINRHWLMHGMYDLDDITRYDCIKLLLMLNQIAKLYSKLKKGEL